LKKKEESTEQRAKAAPLAVVGMGCLFPKADSVGAYWGNIKESVDGITETPETHWRPEDYFDSNQSAPDMTYARRGGFLDIVDFDPLKYAISPNNIEATDTTQLLGMVVAEQALRDAGYAVFSNKDGGRPFDRDRTSVLLGVTGTLELVIPLGARLGHPLWRKALKDAGVDKDTAEDVVKRIAEGYVPWQENSFPGLLGNVAAGRIANRFDLGGSNCVVDAACASSMAAIHLAAMELESGRADMVVTGGLDTFNDIFMYMCFSKTPALSPTGDSRPFSADADGTILGEGLGLVVLKRLEDAKRDNDKIHAVILGMGSSSDGLGNAIYAPSADGQAKALRSAYERAGIETETIELIEAHGTGTKVGDATELESLTRVFTEGDNTATDAPWCAVGSVKSMLGHTKAAAGAAGIIKAVLALKNKVLPPTIKVERPAPPFETQGSPFYVNTVKRPWLSSRKHPRRAAVSAFGFGGSNFHCVLEEAQPRKNEPDWDAAVAILPFSGASKETLAHELSAIKADASWSDLLVLSEKFCKAFDNKAEHRLILILDRDKTDLGAMIASAQKMLGQSSSKAWSTPDGAFYGSGPSGGKLAILFPGQGSQRVGMLRDLACQFPEILNELEEANIAFGQETRGKRLSDHIYPPPVFDDKAARAQEKILAGTQVAQPAIGALSLGAYKTLQRFAVKADAMAGHSFGELTALCAAGTIKETDFHKLANLRGRLMAEAAGDKGGMLAVAMDVDELRQLLEKENIDLVVANHNAPAQAVLSGEADQLEKASAILKSRKIRNKRLPVSAAFHSKFVADAAEPFAQALEKAVFSTPAVPVFANASGGRYPKAAEAARQLLASQISSPVEFVKQINNMYESGVRTFVEVGGNRILTGLVAAILEGRDHAAACLDSSNGKRHGQTDLARLLGRLAAEGHDIDLSVWNENCRTVQDAIAKAVENKKPTLTIPLCGANYVKPRPKTPPREKPVHKKEAPQMDSMDSDKNNAIADNATRTARQERPMAESSDQTLALASAQQSILLLQQMQQQTADLHRKFLEGQEEAQKTIQRLIDQQQTALGVAPRLQEAPELHKAQKYVSNKPAHMQPVSLTPAFEPPPVQVETPPVQPVAVAEVSPVPQTETNTSGFAEINSLILEVIADKTGYPADMLSLEMTLDADLGIDSIKRVEILSALQERLPDAPAVSPDDMAKIRTVGQIADYIGESSAAAAVPSQAVQQVVQKTGGPNILTVILEVIADKTGYPTDMLSPEMTLDADLGIDSIKRVEILSALQERLPDAPAVSPDDMAKIRTVGQITEYIGDSSAAAVPSQPLQQVVQQVVQKTGGQNILTVVLEVIADKTGYPTDMLSPEMTLDADLGIDSIKRVEILSALQERLPDAPAVSPDDMAKIRTVGQIAEYIGDSSSTAVPSQAVQQGGGQNILTVVLEVIADKTGYPADMLSSEMTLDADLGIDSIKRVEILSALQERLPDAPAVSPDDMAKIRTVGQIADYIQPMSESVSEPETAPKAEPKVEPNVKPNVKINEQAAQTASQSASVDRRLLVSEAINGNLRENQQLCTDGVVWATDDGSGLAELVCKAFSDRGINAEVASMDAAPNGQMVSGLVIIAPENSGDDFVMDAFRLVRRAAPSLRHAGKNGGSVLVGACRVDGEFGFSERDLINPITGGLAGIVKTAGWEWPEVACKALDISSDFDDKALLAAEIVDEALKKGPVEVGLSAARRTMLRLDAKPLNGSKGTDRLLPGDVVVAAGGARGVTAEVIEAMAAVHKPVFVLLGRSAPPEPEPAWLQKISDEKELKAEISRQFKKKNRSATPREIEKACRKIAAGREISSNIKRIQDAGGQAIYKSVDVRNKEQVAAAVAEARRDFGPVKAIVHGAGVLADRLIEDQTDEQFELVYKTKIEGLRSLLHATEKDDLKTMVFFSSSTGRFGRKGQAAYAAANEVLNKMAQEQTRKRPDCRVVSVNWGPWDGGMVTPEIKKVFEAEGVPVIPLKAGAEYLVKEIASPNAGAVEVVVTGPSNGAAARPKQETDQKKTQSSSPMVRAFERKIDIKTHPFLASHVINGRAVVPMAMMIEWMAHGAIHENPGLQFHGFDNLRVFQGIKLTSAVAIKLSAMAGRPVQREGFDIIPVVLTSGKTLHAAAEIILSVSQPQKTGPAIDAMAFDAKTRESAEIYSSGELFHGPDLQGIKKVLGCNQKGIRALTAAAPLPAAWMNQPLRSSWIADPLVLDVAFQLMILWAFDQCGQGSLPTGAAKYRQFSRKFPEGGCEIIIEATQDGPHKATGTIEFVDASKNLIARIQGYECVLNSKLKEAFSRNTLL